MPIAERQMRKLIAVAVLIAVTIIVTFLGSFLLAQWPHQIGAAVASDITTYCGALEAYHADMGHYPHTAQGLQALLQNVGNDPKWKGPYMHNETTIRPDPWGHPYKYVTPGPNGESFVISSDGDGRPITTEMIKQNE